MSLFVWTCCSKLLSVEFQQANIDKDNLAHEVATLRLEALRQTEQADNSQLKCEQLEDDLKNERALKDDILNKLKKSQENNEHFQSEFADLMKQNEVMGQDLASQFHKVKQLEKENNELADLNEITYFTLQWNKQKQA